MSTRANIVLKDDHFNEYLWFYRHSDGYPEGALPPIQQFMDYVNQGLIRRNVSQSGGWLIILGAIEYATRDQLTRNPEGGFEWVKADPIYLHDFTPDNPNTMDGWKVGSIEPTLGMHGDIEYLYIVNLTQGIIDIRSVHGDYPAIDPKEVNQPEGSLW